MARVQLQGRVQHQGRLQHKGRVHDKDMILSDSFDPLSYLLFCEQQEISSINSSFALLNAFQTNVHVLMLQKQKQCPVDFRTMH
jgi:hypothetical protein